MAENVRITNGVIAGNYRLETTKFKTAAAVDARELSIPDGSVDLQVKMAIDQSAIVAIAFLSDRNVTLKTNDAVTPIDTINLTANKLVRWDNDEPAGQNPITADVTSFFVTNSAGSAANLKIVAGTDPTAI